MANPASPASRGASSSRRTVSAADRSGAGHSYMDVDRPSKRSSNPILAKMIKSVAKKTSDRRKRASQMLEGQVKTYWDTLD